MSRTLIPVDPGSRHRLPEAVLAAHEAGFAVVPFSANRKPLVASWREWQHRPQTEAEFNDLPVGDLWGILTGALYGIVGLDFDVKHGKQGAETLAKLGLPVHHRTGTGGAHVLVRHPGFKVKSIAEPFAAEYPGLDIRGEGGLLYFHGVTSSGEYQRLVWPPDPIMPTPEVYDLLKRLEHVERDHGGLVAVEVQGIDPATVLAGIAEGGRNEALFRYASRLRGKGYAEAEAQVLVQHAALACEPPYDPFEAAELVSRVYFTYEYLEEERPLESRIWRGSELAQADLPEVTSIPVLGLDGYLGRGLANLVAAYPKVGKTTLILDIIGDALDAGDEVLYLSEESAVLWKPRLTGPAERWENLTLVDALGMPAEQALTMVRESSASIVVVDTLRAIIGWKDENDNAAITQAVNVWIEACRRTGKTFIGLHHARKAGGSGGRAISGGHGLFGAFDQAVEIDMADNGERTLSGLGRIGLPAKVRYTLLDGKLTVKDGPESAWRDEITNLLEIHGPMTMALMVERSGLSRGTVHARVKKLLEINAIREAGKDGRAIIYALGLVQVA